MRLVMLLILVLAALAPLQGQEAPRCRTEPADGATDLRPGRIEITIRFDQDMDGGMSVTMTDLPFPRMIGKPRWLDERSLRFEAEVAADRRYGFGINGAGYDGFKSKDGRIAATRLVSFRTGGGHELEEGEKREAIRRLETALARDYSYRKLHRLEQSFELDREALLATASPGAFAERLAEELARIPDPHLSLQIDGRILPCYRRRYENPVSARVVARRLGDWKQITPACASADLEGGIRYLMLASLSDEDSVGGAIAAIQDAASARGFIIDLRLNGGGNEMLGRALAGLFTAEKRLYARHRSVAPEADDGFGPVKERWLEPAGPGPAITAPVVVLIGPGILSSAEALVLMFRALPQSTLIGNPTGGSSGNPQPHDLGFGLQLNLPSWIAYDAEGRPFEGCGIAPDLVVPCSMADLRAGRDPVLERGIAFLRQAISR
ncbi:MAG: hypothetical protein H6807_16680 [Planctomycetes bacterium]|nr:hypothetical protein [Planctomycetota bacterium]